MQDASSGLHDPETDRQALRDGTDVISQHFLRQNQQTDRSEKISAGAEYRIFNIGRIHALDENSNGNMAHLVAVLEQVAATTGASVLYLHHVSKGSAREGQTDQQQAARGASALIDNARWCGYVARMTEDEAKRLSDRAHDRQPIGNERRSYFVRFGVSKQNYDATPLDRWYMRHAGGVLVPVELYEASRNEEKGRDGRRRGDGF